MAIAHRFIIQHEAQVVVGELVWWQFEHVGPRGVAGAHVGHDAAAAAAKVEAAFAFLAGEEGGQAKLPLHPHPGVGFQRAQLGHGGGDGVWLGFTGGEENGR